MSLLSFPSYSDPKCLLSMFFIFTGNTIRPKDPGEDSPGLMSVNLTETHNGEEFRIAISIDRYISKLYLGYSHYILNWRADPLFYGQLNPWRRAIIENTQFFCYNTIMIYCYNRMSTQVEHFFHYHKGHLTKSFIYNPVG